MKSCARVALSAAFVAPVTAVQQRSSSEIMANPVRKVVTLLQKMQKQVEKEGEEEKVLFDKFMCYCQTGGKDLQASISAAEEKVPAVSSEIEAMDAKITQAKDSLKQAQTDRTAAKAAMKEATAVREKDAATYADFKAETEANLGAANKAVTAVSNGMSGSFLQTPAATALRQLAGKSGVLESEDQQTLLAFLSQKEGYAPQSGAIVGILKQMADTMQTNLDDATAEENEAIKIYKALIAAKTKEVKATTATVEAKTKQIGDSGVELVQMKDDLSDTEKGLAEDKKFLKELDASCKTKSAEWDERQKTRAEELVALADTIKILNNDDALELFKKTLPSPSASLLQVQVSSASLRSSALATLKKAIGSANSQDRAGLEMLTLVLSGRKSATAGGFGKVIKMIDHMVGVLTTEQQDDNDKKEYCEEQFDVTEDKKKGLERDVSKADSAIATAKEAIETLSGEIAALTAGIKALDKSVAEATENRKEENEEYKALVASDTAAKEVLAFAKNRLNKFYNPKLYKAPPKEELSAQDRIATNMALAQGAPPPPPATWDAYAKKSGESTGVIAMIDLLIQDLDKELTEAKTEEKNSQADYEQMMKDAAEKRTTDSKALSEKEAVKADTEAALEASTETRHAHLKELMATEKYLGALHAECDWLIRYFDVRKEARVGEIDALKKAKDVLSGADYSLVQTGTATFLGKSRQ